MQFFIQPQMMKFLCITCHIPLEPQLLCSVCCEKLHKNVNDCAEMDDTTSTTMSHLTNISTISRTRTVTTSLKTTPRTILNRGPAKQNISLYNKNKKRKLPPLRFSKRKCVTRCLKS